jgi:xanthine/uracil permease
MNEPVQRDQAQSQPAPSKPVHPVDEILPLPKLFALGLQHVLVMYANAVAVPLIIGGALHLPKDQMAMLINADLFACGIATLIQTVGFGPFGIRLPIIMGVTAVSISPMLAMTAMPGAGPGFTAPSWSAAFSGCASRRSSNTCCGFSRPSSLAPSSP